MSAWSDFAAVARGERLPRIPVALIVDSPWLPGYAGVDTLDYFLFPDRWLALNLGLIERFPDVAWVPGFWMEYGMAAEPSAFGARVVWHHDGPPSIEPVIGGLAALAHAEPGDPQSHGFMPLVLQRYADAERRLEPQGLGIKMVAARGPLAVAGWLLGITDLMVGLSDSPEAIHRLLDVLTETIIRWLRAQLAALRAPEGILLLDDIPGLLSPRLFDRFAAPYLTRIFESFQGMIRVYHNDTPCPHLLGRIGALPFEVWNFSHEMKIDEVLAAVGTAGSGAPAKALMGNVPPLGVMARGTPGEVAAWAEDCIAQTGGRGLILSAGGGLSPGTPAASIDALVAVARRNR